jgi:hypothetical protein
MKTSTSVSTYRNLLIAVLVALVVQCWQWGVFNDVPILRGHVEITHVSR